MLSEADHKKITDAIARAEQTTSGKIHCVLTQEVSRYREVPLAWAAGAALLLPPIALSLKPTLLRQIMGGWAVPQIDVLLGYALVQIGLFPVVAIVLAIPPIRRVFTPGFLIQHRVRQMAQRQFVSIHHHESETRPHILIYASLADRRVEIIASESIHSLVGEIAWKEMATAVSAGMRDGNPAAGFINAVQVAGAALAKHFPPTPNQN
jgi:putative membrane protein